MLKWNKRDLSKAVQLITGFNNMRNHTGRKTNSPTDCRLCGQGKEDGVHLSRECAKITEKPPQEWEPEDLRTLINNELVKGLMDKR